MIALKTRPRRGRIMRTIVFEAGITNTTIKEQLPRKPEESMSAITQGSRTLVQNHLHGKSLYV